LTAEKNMVQGEENSPPREASKSGFEFFSRH